MTIEDVKITIKNYILNSISQRELVELCGMFNIPLNGRKIQIQKRLIDSVLIATNTELLQQILFMINGTYNRDNNPNILGANQPLSSQPRDQTQNFVQNGLNNAEINRNVNYQLNGYNQLPMSGNLISSIYRICNENLDKCPINLRPEIVNGIDPSNIFIPNYTKYPTGYFNAPSCSPSFVNGRVNMPNVQLPYCVKNTVISSSQFYCCQVVLHPLSLLIPKPTPNIVQTTRIMSKMQLQFTLSNSARHLITAHRSQLNNKRFFKWQVLVRFGVYDPTKPFPNSSENISNLPEYIPPYLTLFVNNATVPLWDILPSNSAAKEGKRHPRPINISDYLKFSSADDQGYRQTINVNWWQTPGVYQYYYFAVYLERKLSVSELFDRFINKTHHVQMPISFTLNFIREKFSTNNQYKKISDESTEMDDDDDLVISSVLPISLLCPVGKSRITCPLRGVYCQHLQCFDAHLYLMMNERRSVWKCPVCDSSATLNELFVDEFFLKILQDFQKNEDLTEVNVNPDGSYVPVAVKESREHKQHIGNIISNVDNSKVNEDENSTDSSDSTEKQPVILLESDDEENNQVKMSSNQNISSSSNNVEVAPVPKPHTTQPKSSMKSLTIDLTSDSEDDIESQSSQPVSSISLSVSKSSSNPQYSHINSQNPSLISQQLPHQYIVPKMPSNFAITSSSEAPRIASASVLHPRSSSIEFIPLTNPYQTYISNPGSSQSKIPQYNWMNPTHRFPSNRTTEIFNSFMPALKPCYNPNFVNIIRPSSTASVAAFPNIATMSHPSSVGSGLPLLPKPMKIDPHHNQLTIIPVKESLATNINPPNNLHSKTSSSNKERRKHKIHETKKLSSSTATASSARDYANARRSSRILNQNRKVYREKSLTDDEESDSDQSDIVSSRNTKRRNALVESSSSSSSSASTSSSLSVSNPKRRRLVRHDRSLSGAEHISPPAPPSPSSSPPPFVDQSDLVKNLKFPLVILNKLDPVVLKVYLQQNEISNPDHQIVVVSNDYSMSGARAVDGGENPYRVIVPDLLPVVEGDCISNGRSEGVGETGAARGGRVDGAGSRSDWLSSNNINNMQCSGNDII